MLDPTLLGLLRQIEQDQIVLPAMQRPFVWKEDRIYRLIDSLLRGFPIGAVMLWKTSTIQRFRRLPRDLETEIPEVFNYEKSAENANKYLVLDGQQRLTSLFAAFKGTYNHKRLFIDVLSGSSEGKDPGNEYYDSQFLSAADAVSLSETANGPRRHFIPVQELIRISPVHAAADAHKKALALNLGIEETERITNIYIRCATILGNSKSLQVIPVDEDPSHVTPIEEILEIFARVNSGGLVLQKSDLLMSLLDLTWNDIQPELQMLVRDINERRPFAFTRDDVLKTLLLAEGAETRFDKLVSNRKQIEQLAQKLPTYVPAIKKAWQLLGCILLDDCKIHSERFFRGGHNALLPFVMYLSSHQNISNTDKKKIVLGIYLSIMSGVFSGAEARMGAFTKNKVTGASSFPLENLMALVTREYGIKSLDDMLRRHLDLTLNIAHGGITLDRNPEELQRDHIFPKSQLEKAGYSYDVVNHYANFHFLRGTDNLNKLDKPPQEWFRNPGKNVPPYSENDLAERLLTWDDLEPGHFESMIEKRGTRIRQKAEELFGIQEDQFNELFSQRTNTTETKDEIRSSKTGAREDAEVSMGTFANDKTPARDKKTPNPIRKELAAVVAAFDCIAPAELKTSGTAANYRQVRPPEWPDGFKMHYEFTQVHGRIGAELHLENSRAARLGPGLARFSGTKVGPQKMALEWDPESINRRGRLKIKYAIGENPEDVARTMLDLIRHTRDAVVKIAARVSAA
jgi:hypothetical protein